MLKASSLGIIRVVLKRQKRFVEFGFVLPAARKGSPQRVVSSHPAPNPYLYTHPPAFLCPSYAFHPRFVQTRAASSSRFASRFFAPLATVTGPPVEVEGDMGSVKDVGGTEQGEISLVPVLPPGLDGTPATMLGEKEPLRRMRSYYLPWARNTAPPVTRVAGRTKGKGGIDRSGRVRGKSAGRKTRLTGKRGNLTTTSEKPRDLAHVQRGLERDDAQVGVDAEVAKALEEYTLQDFIESDDSQQIRDDDKTEVQGHISNNSENNNIIEEDVQVEDLSVEQLRSVILDKNSDLMGLAWDAYHRLIILEADNDLHDQQIQKGRNFLDPDVLTTLANRLITRRKYHRKNSREVFLRLLSVYARLRRERAAAPGGVGVPFLRTPEWNCLIHFAGTGLRGKASLEAYNASLDVYDDMLRGVEDTRSADCDATLLREIEPDIYTYTSLLNIALRTGHQPAIDHAMKLLRESGKEPTRITQLCMVRYRYKLDGLAGVRALLSELKPEDVGADGVGAYMACAGDGGEMDVVRNIYDALRGNVEVREDGTFGPGFRVNGVGDGRQQQLEGESEFKDDDSGKYITVEGIQLPRSLVPTASVYNYVIQINAYYGRLADALQVFTDMLATRRPSTSQNSTNVNSNSSSNGNRSGDTHETERFFQPSYEAFRGLFLGFSRHASRKTISPSLTTTSTPTITLTQISHRPEWNWERLNIILDAFIEHGEDMQPSERVVYWIMIAARRLTGGDERILRDVWRKMNARWCIRKGGRLKGFDLKYGEQLDGVK